MTPEEMKMYEEKTKLSLVFAQLLMDRGEKLEDHHPAILTDYELECVLDERKGLQHACSVDRMENIAILIYASPKAAYFPRYHIPVELLVKFVTVSAEGKQDVDNSVSKYIDKVDLTFLNENIGKRCDVEDKYKPVLDQWIGRLDGRKNA